MFKYLWVRIIIYLFPALLLSYTEGHLGFKFFHDEKQVAKQVGVEVKSDKEKKLDGILYFTALAITIAVFPIAYESQKRRLQYHSKIISKIFGQIRISANKELSVLFGQPDLYLNIRVFLPKKNILSILGKRFNKAKYYEIHNFTGLYIDDVEKLEFQVDPNPQGLVGNCFKDKRLWYDFNLKDNHTSDVYGLKASQIQKTEYCEFGIALPIFNDKDNIDIIITFDSRIKVKEPADNAFEKIIKESGKTITLCKPLLLNKTFNYEPE